MNELTERAKIIKELYRQHNDKNGNRTWATTDYVSGMVGDVGDFVKLIMAKDGLRKSEDLDTKLSHEAADILWSLLIICDELGIDLNKSFYSTMDELEARLS